MANGLRRNGISALSWGKVWAGREKNVIQFRVTCRRTVEVGSPPQGGFSGEKGDAAGVSEGRNGSRFRRRTAKRKAARQGRRPGDRLAGRP